MSRRHRRLALALAALLVGAGCAAPTNQSAPPPGVDADRVTDANELLRTHTETLESQSFTVRSRTTVTEPGADYRVVTGRTWRVDPTGTVRGSVTGRSQTVGDAPERYGRRPDERAAWREGSTTYRRTLSDGAATYRRVDLFNSSVKLSAALQRQSLYRLGTRRNATVERVTRDGTPHYRIAARLNDTAVTTNASMTVLVGTDGVVHRFETRQTVQYRSGKRVVTRSVRFEDVGTTAVERPDWVTSAVNATADDSPGA
jgi:hypothetical protein